MKNSAANPWGYPHSRKPFCWHLRIATVAVLLLVSLKYSLAQQYPVQANAVLIPPYTLTLADYATSNETKLQLQLLMTDLREPTHRAKISFSLEAGSNSTVVAASDPNAVNALPDITLSPGSPLTLTNLDLRQLFEWNNLTGISVSNYSKPLPEGIYNFCFRVTDAVTGRFLSAKASAMIYLRQYAPPQLLLPARAEQVAPLNGIQQILFQWIPRQVAPNTRYVFTLREIKDTLRDVQSAFFTAPIVYEQTLYSTVLNYGPDKPQLLTSGRYAWQVRAISANPALPGNSLPDDDNGVYTNKGYSDIFYFEYNERCTPPTMLTAEISTRGKAMIRWTTTGLTTQKPYKLQYRLIDSDQWIEMETMQMSQLINQLADSATYQYRVGLPCGTGKYVFSAAQEFTTPAANHIKRNFQCGVLPQTDLSNRSPLGENLSPNEIFMAGDFPVTIISASGSAGTYSGTGYIVVPYLGDTKIAVTFSNIQLNTDRQLIAGAVETTYDVTEGNVYDFEATLNSLKETIDSISNQIIKLVNDNELTNDDKTKLDSLKNEATKEIDQAENLNNKIGSLQNQLNNETKQSEKDSIQKEINNIKTAQQAVFDNIKNKTTEFQKIIDKYYASASKFDGIIINSQTDSRELSNTTYRPDDYKVMITLATDSLYAKYSPDFENTEGRFVIWLLYDKTEHKVKYKIKYDDSFFNNQIKKDEYLKYFNKFTAYYTSDSQDWGYKVIDEFYKFNTLLKTSQETGFDVKKLFDAQCADRALKRTIESIVKQPVMSVYNGAIEYGICVTEQDKLSPNASYALKFYYGFLNELLLTVDVNKMAEGISEIVAKNIIKEIDCLTNIDNIAIELTGSGISNERLNFILKCSGVLTPDDLSKYEELINSAWQWAKNNYDNPYYHGKATCFIATIVVPYVGELKALRGLKAEQALNAVSRTEPYYDDFVRLSKELEGKSADEAVKILSKEKAKKLASNLIGSLKTIYDDLINYGYKTTDDGAEIIFKNADNLPIAKISDDALHIKIPYDNGWATQSKTTLSSTIYNTINTERKVYRLGRLNVSQAGEAQFWSPENPYSFKSIWEYADKYGIPPENLKGEGVFFEVGTIPQNVPFITREAPRIGSNSGGAVEVVTPANSVKLESFNTVNFK